MIRILFLTANPLDRDRLRLRQEFDAVQQALDAAKDGARFQLIQEFAATPKQLQALLFRHAPQIVHFSGHGTDAGLLFENEDGVGQPVAAATLRDLFSGFQPIVRCVVLNACYSQSQAAAIGTVIDAVVGMGDVVSDEAALAFAGAFYRALANGTTLGQALALGHNQLDLEELAATEKPQLSAARLDAERVRALDWDQSPPIASTTAPQTINTGGGSNIGGDVTAGGNIAGRDYIGEQHIHYHGETPPAPRESSWDAQPATPRGIFGLYPFNEHFFGRNDELAALHRLLQSEPNVSICPTITGMGGLGKTQLAAHYARANVADYSDGIFWITAADLNSIRPQLADFCVALNLPVADPQRTGDLTEQKISAFKAYLDGHPQALLILDNVEEPDHLRTRQIGVGFTALTLGGKVLVTTRRRKLPGDRFAELPLERLLPEPARQILTTARPDLTADPDLDRLCAQFGYLPLMLNLAAAALKKRGGAIAGYLQKLQEWGIDTLHDRAKVSLDDYHTSLTAVLREQWAMLSDENERLLLRVAGQLDEAIAIPTARLGLLAGLQDLDEWECPLRDALEGLESTSLVEMADGVTVRLHPMVHDFARTLSREDERSAFRTACAQQLADAYADLERLGREYKQRGISALLIDLITAIDFAQATTPNPQFLISELQSFDVAHGNSPRARLQSLLRILRREAHHLHGPPQGWQPEHFWQQLLFRISFASNEVIFNETMYKNLEKFLYPTLHWLPQWVHQHQSLAVEQTLAGHESTVNAVAKLANGHIVSASSDHTLKIWNLQTGQVEQTLTNHEDSVNAVVQLFDGRLISASSDCTLKLWNLQTGAAEQTLTGHNDSVRSVVQLADGRIVSASSDHTLKIWNLQTGQVEQTLINHKGSVNAVVQLFDGRLISTSSDYSLKLWNLQTGEVQQTLIGHEGFVFDVAVIDDNRIISASSDRTLKLWNLQTGQDEQTFMGHEDGVNSVCVADDNCIISASEDRTLKIWNLQTGQVKQTLIGHEDWVNSLAIVSSNRIVSASHDHTLKLWNLQSGEVTPEYSFQSTEQTLNGHEDRVNGVVVVDKHRIISASDDYTLKLWNLQTGTVEQILNGHEGGVNNVAVIDKHHIISASNDRTLKLWNLQRGTVERTFTGHKEPVWSVAVIDRWRIVSASGDCTLKLWNLQTGALEQTFTGHTESVFDVAVIDDRHIVSASEDHTLRIWNLQTGSVEQILTGHEASVFNVEVVNDQFVISVSSDRILRIWNLQMGTAEQIDIGHKASVFDVVVVDERYVVSASSDRTLKVWNLQMGQVIASIGLDGAPQCVTVTRQDGRTLVIAGDAGGALYCLELVEPVDRAQ